MASDYFPQSLSFLQKCIRYELFQVNLGVWGDDSAARESPNSFYNQVQQQREVGSLQQFEPQPQPQSQQPQQQEDQSVPVAIQEQDQDAGFIKPKVKIGL